MTDTAIAPAKSRIAWIDMLRGFAVIFMVETHVVNTFLATPYDEVWWRPELDFLNGLMAPTFLWIAGYMQGASVGRSHVKGTPVFTWARLRRLGLVAFLGCFMGAPWHLWSVGDFSAAGWEHFWRINILPCMALSLAMLLLAGHFGGRRHDIAVTVLMLISVFGAPLLTEAQTGILPIDAFLNRKGGSLFPWFPWFGFAAVGYLASRWPVHWRTYLLASFVLLLLACFLEPDAFSSAHPTFFMVRLGSLALIVTAIWAIAHWVAPRWMLLAGRESLFLYVIHLLIIHCSPAGGGTTIDQRFGHTQGLGQTFFIFAGVLFVSLLLAWANEWCKLKSRPKAAPVLQ